MTRLNEVINKIETWLLFLQVDDLGHAAGEVDERVGQISSVQDGITAVKPEIMKSPKIITVLTITLTKIFHSQFSNKEDFTHDIYTQKLNWTYLA